MARRTRTKTLLVRSKKRSAKRKTIKAITKSTKNVAKKQLAKMGVSTKAFTGDELINYANKYINDVISAKVPTKIPSGDKLLQDNFNKYNELIKAAHTVLKGEGISSQIDDVKASLKDLKLPSAATQLKTALDNAGPLLKEAKTGRDAIIAKILSGIATVIGVPKKAVEIVIYFVQKKYLKMLKQAYDAIRRKNWKKTKQVLIKVIGKLWKDRKEIGRIMGKKLGKTIVAKFIANWGARLVPIVGWGLMVANLISIIKGIIVVKATP